MRGIWRWAPFLNEKAAKPWVLKKVLGESSLTATWFYSVRTLMMLQLLWRSPKAFIGSIRGHIWRYSNAQHTYETQHSPFKRRLQTQPQTRLPPSLPWRCRKSGLPRHYDPPRFGLVLLWAQQVCPVSWQCTHGGSWKRSTISAWHLEWVSCRIDIPSYFVRELVKAGFVQHIPLRTLKTVADALSKSLPSPAFIGHHRVMMGQTPFALKFWHYKCVGVPF